LTYIADLVRSVGDKTRNAQLIEVDNQNVNRFGDVDQKDTETRDLTGVFEIISGEENDLEEGEFQSGELRGFVETYEEGIEEGNIVIYQDKEYRIMEVLKMEAGTDNHLEFRAERV